MRKSNYLFWVLVILLGNINYLVSANNKNVIKHPRQIGQKTTNKRSQDTLQAALLKEKYIHFSHSEFDRQGGVTALISALSHLKDPQSLSLGGFKLNGNQAKAFASALAHLGSLQKLHLSFDIRFEPEAIKAIIPALSHLKNLRTLILIHARFDQERTKALASSMAHLTQLRKLDLSMDALHPEGIKVLISSLPLLRNLEVLDLSDNGIKDEGAKVLASVLSRLKNLRELNISFNQIGDEGLKALASALSGLPHFQKLSLGIPDDTFGPGGNHIGPEGLKAIEKALPHLRLYRKS